MAKLPEQIFSAAQQRLALQDAWTPARVAALSRLEQIGFPNARSNEFYWTPLSLLRQIQIEPNSHIASSMAPDASTILSIQQGSDFTAILAPLFSTNPQTIRIHESSVLELASIDPYAFTRISVGQGVKLKLLWNPSATAKWSSPRLDLELAEDSQVEVVAMPSESMSLRFGSVTLAARAKLDWLEADLGSSLCRSALDVNLTGDQADFHFRALSILTEDQESHRRIRVFHKASQVNSSQWIRHVLQGKAHASCDSTVQIHRNVTGTEGHQLINSLLLAPGAKASIKPTLIIDNDEVQASHGSTCGDLDSNQLFYLRSRGLNLDEARRVLLMSFVKSLILDHPDSIHRNKLSEKIQSLLERRFS